MCHLFNSCLNVHLHVHVHVGRYDNLVSGDYKSDVDLFLSSSHSLAEFREEIEKLRSLCSEISGLDDVVFFDMVQLDCSDIKAGLLKRANELLSQLVHQLASDHLADSQR